MVKRKRAATTVNGARKRVKEPHPHGSFDPEREYKLKSIVGEDATRYLISWEDDEVTGEVFKDTWEPKRNANRQAIEDWEKQKAEKKRLERLTGRQASTSRSNSSLSNRLPASSPLPATPLRKGGRRRRVIEGSSQVEPPNGNSSNRGNGQADDPIEIEESPEATPQPPGNDASPLFEPQLEQSDQTGPAVHLSPPPSSYLAGGYQAVSSSAPHTSERLGSQGTPQDVSDLVDTSQSAGEAADTSHVPSSPSQQAAPSTPLQEIGPTTDFGQGSVNVVPDSQAATTFARAAVSPEPNTRQVAARAERNDSSSAVESPVLREPEHVRVEDVHSFGEHQTTPADGAADVSEREKNEDSSLTEHGAVSSPNKEPPRQTISSGPERVVVDPEQSLPTNKTSRRQNASVTARIDLSTTQDQPASISWFSPTPPEQQPLRPFGFAARRSSLQPLASSALQSPSFPFQTQPSSSIPSIPSQPANGYTFGESAPPAPNTYSSPLRPSSGTFAMEQSPGRPSLLSKLTTMRAQAQAESQATLAAASAAHEKSAQSASQPLPPEPSASAQTSSVRPPLAARLASPFLHERTARSPSAVPAIEPLPAITQEEMNTSRRCETLLPQSQSEDVTSTAGEGQSGPLATATPERQNETTNPNQDPELADVHVVPIYFIGHQRDQYPNMVYFYRDLIQRLLATNSPDADLTSEAKQFINRMRRITIHPDLDNPETALTQYDAEPQFQAKWDVSCSAKFRFLKEFLDCMRSSSLHIAILVEAGRLSNVLETFLSGIEVTYDRRISESNTIRHFEGRGNISVSLLDSDNSTTIDLPEADLVVAMDNSTKTSSEPVRALRKRNGKWSPMITLIVPHSVEHIERCLSIPLSDRARTRALVSGLHYFRNEAGRIQDSKDAPRDTARLIARYLTSAREGREWPLPALANLEDLDSQTDSEVEITVTNLDNSNLAVVGEKRIREENNDSVDIGEASKRSRVESPVAGHAAETTINPQELDITHISDSIEKGTQSNAADNEVESSLVLNSTEKRLQGLLVNTQARLDEHVQVLSDLQYRHEEQRTKLIEVTAERDAAIATAQNAVNRLSEESNKMSNMRGEVSALKEQLKEANAKLLDHTVPERAEFEALRIEATQAKQDIEKIEKRRDQANKDVAYVRDLYQNSSSSAQSLAAQVTELENQLAVAQNQATGEQVKLRQMSNDNFSKNLQDENKKLKVMLREREAAIKFRDEEISKLKEASRGRMGTRGTSVPRSPKIGSPRIGSRQTSPATGELRGRSGLLHPLRNA